MSTKFQRYIDSLPRVFKADSNPNFRALIKALSGMDDELVQQISNTKDQIFVRTAEGQYLDKLASGVGVARISELGLLDEEFQELIPNLSLKAKQIRKTFYDTMDVFWGVRYSRVNVDTLIAPFNAVVGDSLSLKVDGGETQTISIKAADLAVPGSMTAEEMQVFLEKFQGITVDIIEDQVTGDKSLNVRTDSPGPKGSLEFIDGTLITVLGFQLKKFRITDLAQRTAIYEINHKEILIELPAIVPALKRTLKGSIHLHADSTLEGPVAPNNETWVGSFLFSPDGVSYTVTQANATIQETLQAGQVYTKVTVDDASLIPNESGTLIFGWGRENEEQPVRYIGRPNNSTILLDPGHKFTKTHAPGTKINILLPDLKPVQPRETGDDFAIYLTSPSGARTIVEDILRQLTAAGITVNFVVLLPVYKYLFSNPYED